jgi:hypothetical protein
VAAVRPADLYGLPVEEFTKTRDELAKELRKKGKKEAADEVKALRKPTVSAWVINQLARRHPQEMKALVKAGDDLRKAQRSAVSGRDPERLLEATRSHRDRLDDLTSLARHELDAGGQTLQRVAQTLRAGSIDKQASKALLAGTLATDVEQAGFGPLLSEVPLPTRSTRRSAKSKPAPAKPKPRKAPDRSREQEAKLRRQLQEARKGAREERRRADAAAREAERAQRTAEKAEAQVGELEAQLERISAR